MWDIIRKILKQDVEFAVKTCKNNKVYHARNIIKEKTGVLLNSHQIAFMINYIYKNGNTTYCDNLVAEILKHEKDKEFQEIYNLFKDNTEQQLNRYIYNHFMKSKRKYEAH